MKAFNGTKAFALVGWIAWPVLLLILLITYRLTNQTYLQSWATYAGELQAKVWFQEGHLRLLELSSNPKLEFSGRKDGPFEIWTWKQYPNPNWLLADPADPEFVTAFNLRMRQLAEIKPKPQK